MSKSQRVIRSIRFKYRGWIRRFITCSNFIAFIILIIIVILVVTVQDFQDEKEVSSVKLDDFHPATYLNKELIQTVRHTTAKKIVKYHTSIKRNITLSPLQNYKLSESTEEAMPAGDDIIQPQIFMPKIKVRYYAKHPRLKLKTTESNTISFKKFKYRDFFNALAHPKLLTIESPTFPTQPERRTKTGLNDWIQANNPRDKDKFLVYSAYWDDRFDLSNYVRVMAIMVTKNPPSTFCRLVMSDDTAIDVPVVKKIMNEHWRLKYASYFLTCEVSKKLKAPLKVLMSLHRNFTSAALLPVYQNKENIASPKGDFAVCVKPLHYHYDRATWLVEFIELHRILGVEHFFFYNHSVGPNVDSLLRAYIRQNIVTVLPWSLPVRSQKQIRTEAIFSSLNDCVFRTMYLFNYVVMLDFDEYIIPREHESYSEMIQQLEDDNKRIRGKPGSFVFRNTFFYLYWENDTTVYGVEPEKPPDFTPYLITQYKTRRLSTSMKVGSRSKYIVVPERVIEVGNHVVWRHTSGSRAIQVPDTVALLHHYRICEFGGFSCLKKTSLVDRTATRFGPELLRRVLSQCRLVYPDLQGKCPLSPPLGSPW
ncbi:hypothetical protein X975_11956, partial [Stegodyphus mimosarum]